MVIQSSKQRGAVIRKDKVDEEASTPTKEDFVRAMKGLAWIIGTMLESTLSYWNFRVRFLRERNIDVVSKVKVEPLEKGYRAIIEVEATDETINYFALKSFELNKLVKARRRVLKEVTRVKKFEREAGIITEKIFREWVKKHVSS
ncbi:MAG: hypothetical protein QXH10_09280 [Ignisphaera sp.]|uniref:Uncharacterized protein n=1 Tax=Ligamenvirales sp. TaxID=2832923 RepID=A0AAU6PXB2_9VIRU